MKKFLLLLFTLLFAVMNTWAQTTRYVPSGGSPAYATIQAAINASVTGDVIVVAAGTYPETLNLGGKGLTIQGAGSALTIINADGIAGYAIQGLGNSTTIQDLKLINPEHYGIKAEGVTNLTLTNIIVEASAKTGIDLNGVTTATLTNITVTNTVGGFGLMIMDSDNITVNGITTSGNLWGGVTIQSKGQYFPGGCDNIVFSGSFNATDAFPFLIEQDPWNNAYSPITNVTIPAQFTHIAYGFRSVHKTTGAIYNYKQWYYEEDLAGAQAIANGLATSTTFTYTDVVVYNLAETTYSVIPNLKIQDAIDAATAGDVINVEAGNYVESFIIDEQITLQGPNATIAGNGGRNPEATIEGVARVEADNVTIKGLFIDGTNVDQTTTLTMRGILVANTGARANVTIQNNIIKNWVTGISLAGGSPFPWVNGAYIEGNLLINNGIGSTENVNALTIINNVFDNGSIGLGGGAVLAAPITGNSFSNGTGRYISVHPNVTLTFANLLIDNTFDKAAYLENISGQWYNKAIFATIQGAIDVASAAAVIGITGTFGDVNNYTIYDVPITKTGITIQSTTGCMIYGTFIVKANGAIIDGLTIQNKGNLSGESNAHRGAIYVYAESATITDNTITNGLGSNAGLSNGMQIMRSSSTINTLASDYTITGNTLTGHIQGVPDWSSSGIVIPENNYSGAVGGNYYDILVNDYQIATANTFTNNMVDYEHQNWLDWSTAGVAEYARVSNATQLVDILTYTRDGATVLVADGTYQVALSITSPNLTLKSINGRDVTIIDNPNVGSETQGIGVIANMGTVTVDGFTVNNFRNGIIQGMASATGTTFIVKNNKVIPEQNVNGPYLRNGIQVSGANSQIINNYVVGAPLTSTWASTAIHVVNNSGILVQGNTVNTASADIGIGITNWDATLVENITITENTVIGAKNSIRISGQSQAKAVKGVIIEDNVLTNSPTSSGINVQTVSLENLTVTGNVISGHFFAGIRFSGTSATLTGNIVINENSLFNNTDYGLYNGTAHPITATCNWWGTGAFGQIQQEVYGPVTYIPYLTDGTDNSDDPGFQPVAGACNNGFPVQNLTTAIGHANINSALAAAGAGNKIHISSGNYPENVNSPGNLTYSFGGSPGCVTITGDLTYQPTDIVEVDVWGNTACTEFDQITVTGNLNPNGATLTANFGTTPFVPDPMSTFTIYDAGTLTAGSTFTMGTGMGAFGITYDTDADEVILTTLPEIDIAIHEVGCGYFEVVMIPNANLAAMTLTNVVFTIQYPDVINLTNLNYMGYNLLPGATLDPITGYEFITVVGEIFIDGNPPTGGNGPWTAGNEYPIFTFRHDQSSTATGTGDFTIWSGTDPTNSYSYYAEYLGSDVTGDITNDANGSWLDGCPVKNVSQTKWYYEIQQAIDEASTSSTDIIEVYYKTRNLGIYPEMLVVDRAIDLRGPNYLINPNTGTRAPEAVIAIPSGALPNADGDYPAVDVLAGIDGVSIKGFTVDGSNLAGTTTWTVGVYGKDLADNLTISNNIIKNFWLPVYSTSYFWNTTLTPPNWDFNHWVYGTSVSNNYIFSNDGRCPAYGIYLQGSVGNVSGNVINNAKRGIQIQPYNHPSTDTYYVIDNTVTAFHTSLWYNCAYTNNKSIWVFEDNLLKGQALPVCATNTDWEGIRIESHSDVDGTVTFIGNSVDKHQSGVADTYGIYALGYTGTAVTTITNNEIIGAEYGIYLNNGVYNNITENSITGYTTYALTNLTASTISATCNWWGDADMNDVSDAISGSVIYLPYLITNNEVAVPAWTNGFDPLGPCQSPLTFKVFLQGPYVAGGSMTTAINGELPNSQPFNVAPWNYNGTETLPTTLTGNEVDWVLVEMRETASGTAYSRSAGLLHSNGSVTANLSNPSPVLGNSYYFVIYQRNHMPVMSAIVVNPYTFSYPYDFTLLSNLYDNVTTPTNAPPAMLLETGVYGMIAGDVTHNGLLQYSGAGNDRGPIIAKIIALMGGTSISQVYSGGGYFFEDVNMNNELKYTGAGNDRALILSNLDPLSGSTLLNAYYISEVPGYYTGPTKSAGTGPVYIAHDGQTISLGTTLPIASGLVDNVQFTLAWMAGDEQAAMAVAGATSGFQLQPQGEPVTIDGVTYQVFVSVVPTALPEMWTEGTRVTALTLGAPLPEGSIWVADNGFTGEHNADYYVSVWGSDLTGEIKMGFTGIGDPSNNSGMKVYPNPVSGSTLFIEAPEAAGMNLTMSVYDMQGRLMMSQAVNFGMSRMELKTATLPAGMYILKLSNETLLKQTRFVVID